MTTFDEAVNARILARLQSLRKDDVNVDLRGSRSTRIASGVPFWCDAPDAYDTVILAGQALPGIVTPRGKAFSVRADGKRAAGQDGESLTVTGIDPADFELVVKMWTPEHLKAFAEIAKLIRPKRRAGKPAVTGQEFYDPIDAVAQMTWGDPSATLQSIPGTPLSEQRDLRSIQRAAPAAAVKPGYTLSPMRVYHPFLALFGISACVVLGSTLPASSGSGIYEARLTCREFKRPKAVGVTTPTAAVGSAKQQKIESLKTAFGTSKPSDKIDPP